MKSVKSIMMLLVATIMLAACNKVSHKKTPGGMPYQVYGGKGQLIAKGNIVKLNYTQQIKDSVYFTTRGKLPLYWPVTEQTMPYDISELWLGLKKGDSVIATQLMDTFIKRNPTNIPPEFKNGDRIITTIHILDVFTSDSLAHKDEEKVNKDWLVSEVGYVQKWLADKNINAQKTRSGAFVQVINPGTGDLIDSGKYVSVNYTGTSFSGKVFDSNTDSTFRHVEPMTFPVGMGQMIKGFDEAMTLLRPGAEAKVYIPSMLAYGARPMSPDIKPFEHIMFDIKVTNVQNEPPSRPNPGAGVKVDTPQRK